MFAVGGTFVYFWVGVRGGKDVELGGFEEGVGSEDGGDDFVGGVDGVFVVGVGFRVIVFRVGV